MIEQTQLAVWPTDVLPSLLALTPGVSEPERKSFKAREPENPAPLGEMIVRMHVEALRPEERAALRSIRAYGPMTVRRFAREHKLPKAMRERVLRDLDRFGLIAAYVDAKGRIVIHATDRAEPLLECHPDESLRVTRAVRAMRPFKSKATGPS